jgi:outer membrane lipoprotein-sorting protein
MVMIRTLVLLFFSVSFTSFVFSQEAKEVVRKADEKAKGKTSMSTITIQTIRPGWTRDMTVKGWTKGNDLSLILVLAPAKEKEVWNWVPSIERNIKMPPSMMSQSWMGTDFTNDDLVKEASILEDYDHSFLEDVTIDGRPCYQVQLIPKPKSAVVWGKVIMAIDKKDFMMLHVEYYDEDGELINTMHCSDIKLLGGRMLPARMEMVPANKKGNKTVLVTNSMVFDTPIDDSFFSVQNITKVK